MLGKFFAKLQMLFERDIRNRATFKTILVAAALSFVVVYAVGESMFDSFDSAKSGALVISSAMIWLGLFDAILEVSDQRKQIKREFVEGQGALSSTLAMIVVRIVHALLQTLCMTVATFVLVDTPNPDALIFGVEPDYILTLFCICFSSHMLGLAVSALSPTNITALKAAPPILIFELIFSGMLIGLPEKVEQLTKFTICRWGVEAIGSVFNIDSLDWSIEITYREFGYDFFNGHDNADFLFTNEHLIECVTWLGLLALVAAVVTFAAMKYFQNSSQRG